MEEKALQPVFIEAFDTFGGAKPTIYGGDKSAASVSTLSPSILLRASVLSIVEGLSKPWALAHGASNGLT